MKPFRFSLTFSILSSLACLLGLSWILLSIISFKTAEQDLLAQKNEEGRVLLAGFVSLIPGQLHNLQRNDGIGRFMDNLARERDFAGIVVVDRAASPVYSFKERGGADDRLRETLVSGADTYLYSGNGLYINRYAAVRADGRVIGATRLSLSLAGEHERLKRSRQIFFAYFVLDFLLLLGLGSYLLSRIVVAPIKRLLTATERVGAGEYGHAVHVPGSAEIAELAESFTTMQEALRVKQEEADSYVKSLEKANAELQAAREESIRSEKMASVGLLAAGMAHEIGTPLSAIIGYAGILQDEERDDPVKADYLRRIESEAGRIDRLIRGLLDYARPTSGNYEEVAIVPLVGDTLELFADRDAFRTVRFIKSFEPDLPAVHADRHQLQQVLINLVMNARDAMPEGGELYVSACRSHFNGSIRPSPCDAPVSIMGRRRDDFARVGHMPAKDISHLPCVRLDVRDSGEGIAPDNLAKIFDPFFTTKEPGKGTGLGLAISARIIDTFGGRITLESTPGKGSTFILWLPAAE